MKKIFVILSILISAITSFQANAKDGVYLGTDLIASNARWKYYGGNDSAQKRVDGSSIGAGATLGYKKSFSNGIFIAPELFYDYLNSSTKDYYYNIPPFQQDTLELRSRYGAKANLGYNLDDKFSTYATYGLASVDHIDNYPSNNQGYFKGRSNGKWKTSAIYGVGAIYNINENWGIKTEFNTQRFNVPYAYDFKATSKVRLNVLKAGLFYSF